MKEFSLRAIFGAIYVTIIVVGIMWSLSFFFLFSLTSFFCLQEFYGLINASQKTTISFLNCLGGVVLFFVVYSFASGLFSSHIFWLYIVYIVLIFISELYQNQKDPIIRIGYILVGQCYIALPLSLLNLIAFTCQVYSFKMLLSLFVFTWTNDSISFLFGKKFGIHPLFERISPRKSWEGFLGGLFFTILVSFIFSFFIPIIPLYHWIGIAMVVSLFGVWGDLIESLIKRTLQVKDSGVIIPGHGGFLDRFDSLLIAIYSLCFYLEWFVR